MAAGEGGEPFLVEEDLSQEKREMDVSEHSSKEEMDTIKVQWEW